jgi:sterol desaturase/sphingolipid hydroxylase (fatty acid hydroxylase superfamily)
MTRSEFVPVAARLLGIAGAIVGAAAAASLAFALFAIPIALVRGDPIPEFTPRLPDLEITGCLLLFAAMTLGVAAHGWKGSALRRVLTSRDASTRTDLFYFVLTTSGLMTTVATLATVGVTDSIDAFASTTTGLELFAGLPAYVTVPSALVVGSLMIYWIHRAEHTPLLWPLHAVHHAGKDFNILLFYRRHPAVLVFRSIALFVLLFLGFPLGAIASAFLILRAATLWAHSDLPTNAFVERWIVFGPRGHGIHHGADPSCFNTNYGDLVIWDRLFGTYKADAPDMLVYGCDDPDGIYQSGNPLHDIIAVEKAWLRAVWQATVRSLDRLVLGAGAGRDEHQPAGRLHDAAMPDVPGHDEGLARP